MALTISASQATLYQGGISAALTRKTMAMIEAITVTTLLPLRTTHIACHRGWNSQAVFNHAVGFLYTVTSPGIIFRSPPKPRAFQHAAYTQAG